MENKKSNFFYWKNESRIHIICFIFLFLLVSFWFNYFDIFNYAPHATHSWRQTDCTSFVQNYYNDGMDFFSPRIHHYLQGQETKTAPSEFPILYYLTAGIWKISTPHDGILRVLNILILHIGFFFLSKLVLKLTKDLFYALFVGLFLMSSPVIAFYGFNFLPNIPALGFSFIAFYLFYDFYKKQNSKSLVLSCFFFLLAGLLKVTSLLPFIAIITIFFLEKTKLVSFKSEGNIFKKGWGNLLLFASVFLIIGSWILWVKNYNLTHDSSVFILKTKPIWALSSIQLTQVWDWINGPGAPQYFHYFTRYFILGLTVALLLFLRKKQPKIIYFFNVLIVLGTISVLVLFFFQFFVHNYYTIELMAFPAAIFTTLFFILKTHYGKIGNHFLVKTGFALFLIFNLNYAKGTIEERYTNASVFNKNFERTISKKMEVRAFLKNLNITYPEKVISIPDDSPNFNLNYFNLRGWSEFAMSQKPLHSEAVQKFKELGAKYLIITDKKYLESERLKPFLNNPLDSFENTIFVFQL